MVSQITEVETVDLTSKTMELIPTVQSYAWGKRGSSSLVGRLMQNLSSDNFSEEEKYAELWIGTHPSGHAVIRDTKEALGDWIKKNPSCLGPKVLKTFGAELPFLFKVLSVETALSIQAHPDKQLGKELHEKFPDVYKDPNHKPEMAIALTDFEVMCGFRSEEEIFRHAKEIPELGRLLGNIALSEPNKENLKLVYTALMKTDPEVVKQELESLLKRIDSGETVVESDLVSRLAKQYPGDVGIFSVFFLQHYKLKPGEALFLPANEPHAYIHGDCVECMATSDNVVRAGLTPKFKDVDTLTKMLTYVTGKDWIVQGKEVAKGVKFYDVPVPEFAVIRYEVDASPASVVPVDSCSVFLCINGQGSMKLANGSEVCALKPGTVFFLPDKSEAVRSEIVIVGDGLLVFQAYAKYL